MPATHAHFALHLAWSLTPSDLLALLPLLALGALVYALVLLGWLTFKLAKPPRRTFAVALAQGRPADPSQLPQARPFREFTFAFAGLQLHAWDVPGDDPSGPICVLTHGFGDSRLGGLSRVPALVPCCSRIVLWDMPGHGESPGSCAQGTHEVSALLALLGTLPEERKLVLFGWSLGAGVSIACGASWRQTPQGHRLAGIIAESPYRFARTPASNVLRSMGMPGGVWLRAALGLIALSPPKPPKPFAMRDEVFDRARFAASLRGVPLLVLHGSDDHVSPIADGRAIAEAAGGTLIELPGGGHFGLWTEGVHTERCTRAVQELLRGITGETPVPPVAGGL